MCVEAVFQRVLRMVRRIPEGNARSIGTPGGTFMARVRVGDQAGPRRLVQRTGFQDNAGVNPFRNGFGPDSGFSLGTVICMEYQQLG